MSDKPMRFFASEIILEQIFLHTNQEASKMHSSMQMYWCIRSMLCCTFLLVSVSGVLTSYAATCLGPIFF